jgi:hypothetical protein
LAGDDDESETGAEAVLVRWVTDFTGRLSTLGWKHPWPEAAGEVEISRLVVAALHLDPDSVPATPAPPALTDQVRPEHVARLELENRTLRAKLTWFEDAVRHRDTQLAAVRHNQQDPRPRLSRKLSEAESELVAIRASRSYLLGQALTSPLRAIRARTRQ